MATIDDVRSQLSRIRYPGFRRDLLSYGMVRDVSLHDATVRVQLDVPSRQQAVRDAIRRDVAGAIVRLPGVSHVDVEIGDQPSAAPTTRAPLPGVAHIVAVASGKGGVGKSTVAVNLALALHREGLRVGLLDADVHGPSVPLMTGATDARPRMMDTKKIVPVERFGIKLVSMGFFLDDTSPVIWRGPMVMSIVRQFLKDVVWEDLDVLVVDLPPGTGDAQLTLLQEVAVTGGVIVTTPQDVALQDVRRGIQMFATVQTPVLGVIENMSGYVCPHCGTTEDLFGSDGGRREAAALGVPVLASIPLIEELRVSMDEGRPLVAADPTHPVARIVTAAASEIAARLRSRADLGREL